MDPVKRRYESSRRQRQAQQTQEQITKVARRLFARDGFARTTVEAIAREAEVSPRTIYAAFGSKRGILFALLEQLRAEGGLEELRRDIQTTSDPRQQLQLIVRFSRCLIERGQDVLEIAMGTRSDPDVDALWREAESGRREGQDQWVRAWAEAGTLRPGLGEKEAADVLWSLTGPETYVLLVIACGWSGPRFEKWIIDTLEWQLFGVTRSSSPQNTAGGS